MRADNDHWSKEEDEWLESVYLSQSYSQIASQIGRSRCAVSGRVKRLKLPPKQRYVIRDTKRRVVLAKPKTPKPEKQPKASKRSVIVERVAPRKPYYAPDDSERLRDYIFGKPVEVTTTMVTLAGLEWQHCRRPSDTKRGVMFCGKPIDPRYGSYCSDCGPYLWRPAKNRYEY